MLWRGAICAGILALFESLVGCDLAPMPRECPDTSPPCSTYAYHNAVSTLKIDSATNAYLVTNSTWSANFVSNVSYYGPDPLSRLSASGPSLRAASTASCAPCSGAYFITDSAYFTTDLVTFMGVTLKAGENLLGRTLPVGIHVSGNSVTIENLTSSTPTIRFKDSLFEIHFSGTIDSIRNSASAKFRVTDSALLLP